MNLSTNRIWCYECKKEVFLDSAFGHDSDQESCTGTRDSGRGSYSTLRTNTPERGKYFLK